MGDFSRDPKDRLADSIAKHYVGVRLQQGVPLLDADWNLLEDLRRHELEDVCKWTIGNGVPAGNDGFRIAPIAGGGINTIVLVSKSTGVGLSSVKIDIANSTAANALGFDSTNFMAVRFGSYPAQITGNKAEPFTLTNGSTLVVQVDNQPPETITFPVMASATAIQVIAAITADKFIAKAGEGNDFIIKGGDGTTANAGRILVDGHIALNETDLKYTEQPLYENDELAKVWGVDKIAKLSTPVADELYIVYLDVWHREVDPVEDPKLIDNRIGTETSVRQRRESAVRVAKEVDYIGIVAAKPSGHSYYKLAHLNRIKDKPGIEDQTIIDERDTDHSLQREIAYRGSDGSVLVDSRAFLNMLVAARDNIRDFIEFLTTKFVQPSSAYVAGEVVGIDVLSSIASIADQGIALLNTKSLDTKGAFTFFEQFLEAEKRFVNIWKIAVLPIMRTNGKIYETAYKGMIQTIESFLTGPTSGLFLTVAGALQRRNLLEAIRSQDQINSEFGNETAKPIGSLVITYIGSPTPLIVKNQNFDLRYRLSGNLTPKDTIQVDIFIDAAWQTTLRNSDGSLPFQLEFGPGSDSKEFIVTVRAPNVDEAQTQISLAVSATHNRGATTALSGQSVLHEGYPPPAAGDQFALTFLNADAGTVNGVFQVPVSPFVANMTFTFRNNTNAQTTVNLEFDPAPASWIILPVNNLIGQVIPPLSGRNFTFQFGPPGTPGQTLTFNLCAKDSSNKLLAEIKVNLITISGS